jgi:WD40 repeat protein
VAFDFTGERLACCFDKSVAAWSIQGDRPKAAGSPFYEAADDLHHVEFNRAGNRLLVQGSKGVTTLDVGRQATLPAIPLFDSVPHLPPAEGTDPHFLHSRFLDDESFLAVEPDKIVIYDATSGSQRHVLDTGPPYSMTVNAERSSILVGGSSMARLWHQGSKPSSFRAGHGEPVVAIAFHPNGTFVATGSLDGQVRLWKPDRNRPFALIPHPSSVMAICYSPDGQLLATAQADGLLRVWKIDPRTYEWPHRVGEVPTGDAAPSIALTPDGKHWFISRCDPDEAVGAELQVYSMSGHAAHPPLELDGPLTCAAMSPRGDLLATSVIAGPSSSQRSEASSRLQFWRWPSREPLGKPVDLPVPSTALAFRTDGRQLALLTQDGHVRLLDPRSPGQHDILGSESLTELNLDPLSAGLRYTRDGSYLVSWNGGTTVCVWSTDSGKPRYDPLTLPDPCTYVALSDDEQWVATATAGGDVRVWSLETGQPATPMIPHASRVNTVRFSPDGNQLLTSCEDDHVRTIHWRDSGKEHRSFNARTDTFDAAFFPNGKWFVTASDYNPCTVHDAQDGQLMFYLNPSPHLAGTTSRDRRIRLTFSPDGRYLLTAGERESVCVFDLGWMSALETADWRRLQWEVELSGGRRIVEGTATPISSSEWLASWREFEQRYPVELGLDTHPTP